MISDVDDPFARRQIDGMEARPVYGDFATDVAAAVFVTRDGGVYTLDARPGRGKAKLRLPFVTSSGATLAVRLPGRGGTCTLSLERAVALAWFHCDKQWKQSTPQLDASGLVCGVHPSTPSPVRSCHKGTHIRTFTTKVNTLSWYSGGVLEINGRRVGGVMCMGQVYCWVPHEGFALLAALALRARRAIPAGGHFNIAFRDLDPANLQEGNLAIVPCDRHSNPLPPRLARVLKCFLDDVPFDTLPELLQLKQGTVYSYAYDLLRFHLLPLCQRTSLRFVEWTLGSSQALERLSPHFFSGTRLRELHARWPQLPFGAMRVVRLWHDRALRDPVWIAY